MTLFEKCNYIQTHLKAPKGQYNKFGGYAYRSCEDILGALTPLLAQTKTALITRDEPVQIGERFYVKATAQLFDVENAEAAPLTSTGHAREPESKKGMDESQITGSAASYALKRALGGLFAIDDEKDADARNAHERNAAPQGGQAAGESRAARQEPHGAQKPQLAGGETSLYEKHKLETAFGARYPDNASVFAPEEIAEYKKMRAHKTAAQLIEIVEREKAERLAARAGELPIY